MTSQGQPPVVVPDRHGGLSLRMVVSFPDRHGGLSLRMVVSCSDVYGACPYDGCGVFGPELRVAESEGFEPPDLLQSTVFKTAAFDRSANSPVQVVFGADYI